MRLLSATFLLLACCAAGPALGLADVPLQSLLISAAWEGGEGDSRSDYPAVSSGARWVAFDSESTDLVPDDMNGAKDVFLRDTSSGTTRRVSVSTAGAEGDGQSFAPEMSDDGRFVVFESWATNFAASDRPSTTDVFLHDVVTRTTVLVSADGHGFPSGGSRAELSGDGLRVAYIDDAGLAWSWHRLTGEREVVSIDPAGAALSTRFVSISGEPHVVAFEARDPEGIYLRDLAAARTDLLVHPGGQGHFTPMLSSDGSALVFMAANFSSDPMAWLEGAHFAAIDLVHVDLTEGTTQVLARTVDGYERPSLSADGRYVSFVSMGGLGTPPNLATPLVAIYRWDTLTGDVAPMVLGPHGAPEGVPVTWTAITPEGDRVAYAHLDAEEYALGLSSVLVDIGGRMLLDVEPRLYDIGIQMWLSPPV